MGGVPWGLRGGGLKMGVGGSPNRGWGHLDPNGDPKPYGDFSTAVSARSWGAGGSQNGSWGSQNGGGGVINGGGGLKMGVGGTSIPMQTPKSYGDFSTMVSARS